MQLKYGKIYLGEKPCTPLGYKTLSSFFLPYFLFNIFHMVKNIVVTMLEVQSGCDNKDDMQFSLHMRQHSRPNTKKNEVCTTMLLPQSKINKTVGIVQGVVRIGVRGILTPLLKVFKSWERRNIGEGRLIERFTSERNV